MADSVSSKPKAHVPDAQTISMYYLQVAAANRAAAGLPWIDFVTVNRAALRRLPDLLARWLPQGRRHGSEWVARNPRRDDRRPGSFKINICTGRWKDFATGDKGGDVVSLAAYLFDLSQVQAARIIAGMLGISTGRIAVDDLSRDPFAPLQADQASQVHDHVGEPASEDVVTPVPDDAEDPHAAATRQRVGPEGWDLADALEDGWDPEHLREVITDEGRGLWRRLEAEPVPERTLDISYGPYLMDPQRGLDFEGSKRNGSEWVWPPMEYAGRIPLYPVDDGFDAWAVAKIEPRVGSTSERRARQPSPAPVSP